MSRWRSTVSDAFHRLRALVFWLAGTSTLCGGETAAVFDGPPAPYQREAMRGGESETLRWLSVEERTGEPRRRELVRVPLFFAAGECAEPSDVAVAAEDGGATYPTQHDDVRRAPDGGVSRMHLWFEVDLAPWEKRRFRLVRRAVPAPTPGGALREAAGRLVATGDGLEVVLGLHGTEAGKLLRLDAGAPPLVDAPQGLAPRVTFAVKDRPPIELSGQDAPLQIEWADGPLFAKVRMRWAGPGGATLEQVYQIGKHERRLRIIQTARPPDAAGVTLARRELLEGEVAPGGGITAVPAGLRRALRRAAGSTVSALSTADGGALVAVPDTSGGNSGRMKLADRRFVLDAPAHIARASADAAAGTLRAFWTAGQLVPTREAAPDGLWETYHRSVQPLVAVVDEPGAGRAELQAALRALVREMKPVGWRQEAGRAAVLGNESYCAQILRTQPKAGEAEAAALIRSARSAWQRVSADGTRRVRENEKARAAGPLDPYGITYAQSAAAVLELTQTVPERVTATTRAYAEAARSFLGRTGEDGFPYLDCFARALNMQMGALLFGSVAARGPRSDLGDFYRALATAPAIRAVYGRAQRPYAARVLAGAEVSDTLYQGVVDFWMRTAELASGADFELHPLAYARYTDCVDVMADLYHGADPGDKDGTAPPPRANFWRSQPHVHRWLGWSCAPFMRLLESPGDLTGATEAIRYCEMLQGRWKNWPDLTYYLLAALLTREEFRPAVRQAHLPLPPGVRAERADGGMAITWQPVPGATEYRVYRAHEDGGAVQWLNSPYLSPPVEPTTGTTFSDAAGTVADRYFVTAVDAAGRESRWFADEPR